MRIGQVAGQINLIRLQALDKLADDADVVFAERPLGDRAGLVEGEIEEVQALLAAAGLDRAAFSPPSLQRIASL